MGRPPKRKRNTTGLKNQAKPSSAQPGPVIADTSVHCTSSPDMVPEVQPDTEVIDDYWVQEGLTSVAQWYGYKEEESDNEDCEINDWEEEWFDSEELLENMFRYAAAMDDDVQDADWIPDSLSQEGSERKKRMRKQREQKG